MGFDRRFELGLAWRALAVLASFSLVLAAFRTEGLYAARIVTIILALFAVGSLWSFIRRTNFEVARFIESVRFEDYSQRFRSRTGTGGFDVLGEALDRALEQVRARRTQLAEETRFLSAVVDDTPVALLAIHDDGRVDLLNKLARRIFVAPVVTRTDQFVHYGAELAAALTLPPGGRRLTRIVSDGSPQRAILASARVERLESGLVIASLLPAQPELGAVEMETQAELVRVLTHEIMNSLTPVTSLAHSSAQLIASAADDHPALADASSAAGIVARRADSLLRFVDRYRDFGRALDLKRRRFDAQGWLNEIARAALSDPRTGEIDLQARVDPPTLRLDADPDLLAQVILNLVRNAANAMGDQPDRRVVITISRRREGAVIEVCDNGPGIPLDRRQDVFLPFYTTRPEGSGVGLSFARQVALAHGGSIEASDAEGGGACIRLLI